LTFAFRIFVPLKSWPHVQQTEVFWNNFQREFLAVPTVRFRPLKLLQASDDFAFYLRFTRYSASRIWAVVIISLIFFWA